MHGVRQVIANYDNHLIYMTSYPEKIGPKDFDNILRDIMELNDSAVMGAFTIGEDGRLLFRSTISLLGRRIPHKNVLEENLTLGLFSIGMFHDEVWSKYHPTGPKDPMFR